QHVEAIKRETEAIVAALRDDPIDLPVPSCPEWTLGELANHVGEFTGFWTHVLCESTGRPKTPFPDMPSGNPSAVSDWYKQLAGHLIGELRATAPDTTIWTWVPDDKSTRFAARRCANELAVHRFDMQLARGRPEPIEAVLAADGIEEIFIMIEARSAPTGQGNGETIHLHGIDRGDEWVLTLTTEGLVVDRHHAKADLALRGKVSDLELILYQRPTLSNVEHIGDGAALEAWHRAFTFG
ncbi:MAG: maleylpyruvate isomerase family mycothiol-dependent enzyme, partial [Nitrososphaerales archaeon]